MSDKLQQAIAAIQVGDKATARQLLAEILQTDPDNEKAWLWMASAAEYEKSRQQCLEYVLEINPTNEVARRELATLQAKLADSPGIETLSKPVGTPLPISVVKAEYRDTEPSSGLFGGREGCLSLWLTVVMGLSLLVAIESVCSGQLMVTLLSIVQFVLALGVWHRQSWGAYGLGAFFALLLVIGLGGSLYALSISVVLGVSFFTIMWPLWHLME